MIFNIETAYVMVGKVY